METETPNKGAFIEGCWDVFGVNQRKAIATGDRIPHLGVCGMCDNTHCTFKYWRYLGEKGWRDGR